MFAIWRKQLDVSLRKWSCRRLDRQIYRRRAEGDTRRLCLNFKGKKKEDKAKKDKAASKKNGFNHLERQEQCT